MYLFAGRLVKLDDFVLTFSCKHIKIFLANKTLFIMIKTKTSSKTATIFINPIEKDFYKQIGYRLRLARTCGLKQLSKVLGISHPQLIRYELGQNRLSLYKFCCICKFLKVNPLEILGGYYV